MEANLDDNCHFCKSCKVDAGRPNIPEPTLHDIFHSPCNQCSLLENACDLCQHLRIPHLLLCKPWGVGEILMAEIGTMIELQKRISECHFCRFFCSAVLTLAGLEKQSKRDIDNSQICLEIRKRSFQFIIIYERHFLTSAKIAAWSESKMCYLRDVISFRMDWHSQGPEKLQPHVNWGEVSTFIQQDPMKALYTSTRWPRGLKVIDVNTDCVVPGPLRCKYIALSYVFGGVQLQPLQNPGSFHRQGLPRTIHDAIVACEKLGFRYLWVDQLCIDQENEIELQEQINQMHLIYQCARCTLVALAGEDSTYGLPGVTTPRGWSNSSMQIGDIIITNAAPSLNRCYYYSKWPTRGWTFQEMIFSSKLVFFTDYGVHYVDNRPFSTFNSEAFCEEWNWNWVNNLSDYCEAIRLYTTRSLSYPSDIIRACSAVLQEAFGNDTYYGLPRDRMDEALGWLPQLNHPPTKTDKRTGFPSWSWTSHSGPVEYMGSHETLCLWATPAEKQIVICKPNQINGCGNFTLRGRKHEVERIAEAWLAGCIQSPLPIEHIEQSNLSPRQSRCPIKRIQEDPTPRTRQLTDSQIEELGERWGCRETYWDSAFGGHTIDSICSPNDRQILLSREGLLLFHGQTAHFYVRRSNKPAHDSLEIPDHFQIRTDNGSLSGAIRVPSYHHHRLENENSVREFLSLSTARALVFDLNYALHDEDVSDEDSLARHRATYVDEEAYHNRHGILLKEHCEIVLYVMLIHRDPATGIACRLGLGQIFLKEWVEADPEFKTVILE